MKNTATMTAPAAAAASVGFATSGDRDAVFARVGELLAGGVHQVTLFEGDRTVYGMGLVEA